MGGRIVVARKNFGTESDLFLRMWGREAMPASLAKQVLKFAWTKEDEDRMHDLAVKNREGEITKAELREMDEYLNVSMVISILQSRARKTLRTKSVRGLSRV